MGTDLPKIDHTYLAQQNTFGWEGLCVRHTPTEAFPGRQVVGNDEIKPTAKVSEDSFFKKKRIANLRRPNVEEDNVHSSPSTPHLPYSFFFIMESPQKTFLMCDRTNPFTFKIINLGFLWLINFFSNSMPIKADNASL